tara:strand:+ start:10681 stop:10956 length:276 start_codon:yes stop_codon:yes gene_type:complete
MIESILKKGNYKILDVRTKMEYFMVKIDGSSNIPLNQIPYHIEDIRAMQPVIIYCAAGVRSAQAVSFLKQEGLTEVYDGGGIDDLRQKLNK